MKTLRDFFYQVQSGMTRQVKQAVLLSVDLLLAPLVFACSALLVGQFSLSLTMLYAMIAASAISGAASVLLRLPLIQLKSYDVTSFLRTAIYALVATCFLTPVIYVLMPNFPVAGIVIHGLLLLLGAAGARLCLLHLLLWVLQRGKKKHKVIIYGAGQTGTQLVAALRAHERIMPVAFVDDDACLHGTAVGGFRVYAPEKLKELAAKLAADRVILAMPSVSAPKLARLSRNLRGAGLTVQALPSFSQLVGEEELVDTLAPVAAGQFLGRDQVGNVMPQSAGAYRGKSIFVSGAGGSVGAELCRQILKYRPARLVLYELSEAALYLVDRELQDMAQQNGVALIPVLGSVTDARLTRMVLKDHKVQVVFHAAAYKHVPLVEANPVVGLANNVLGTRNLAEMANEEGVERFILISSDKAVRPTNVMGASKRLAELVVQDMAKRSRGTIFSMVRFGNVLGSSGSVIPLFKEQIAKGGPVTLTHEAVTRYFMTISEAANLVLLAGSFSDAQTSRGGDVFVLDMGKPVLIRDLAVQLIHAAGYSVRDAKNPGGDIEIVVTGMRPGEKLHEELLIGAGLLATPHSKILRAREENLSELEMASALRALRAAVATGDPNAARGVVLSWVHGYQPAVYATGTV